MSNIPGVLLSPFAGALLDRKGRKWLIILDFGVACITFILIGALSYVHVLNSWGLLIIVALSSLTMPLSASELRSLYPLLVPANLWERMNAIDSNTGTASALLGPVLAGIIVGFYGGEAGLFFIGTLYGLAGIVMLNVSDPTIPKPPTHHILKETWQGLRYLLGHKTLRALALSLGVGGLSTGMLLVALPVLAMRRFSLPPQNIGILLSLASFSTIIASMLYGRMNTLNKEKGLLVWPQIALAVPFLITAFAPNVYILALSLLLDGLIAAPIGIALFTIRQRRTPEVWRGRAFAISMSLNFIGFPIGSAMAGPLIAISIPLVFILGAILSVLAGVIALLMIPQYDSDQAGAG